jgi:molybdopterin biosynthesis enzyme
MYFILWLNYSIISLGQLVVSKGDKIGSTEIGLLSSLGISNVSIYPSPTIAVLSTGNELVESHETPIAGYFIS